MLYCHLLGKKKKIVLTNLRWPRSAWHVPEPVAATYPPALGDSRLVLFELFEISSEQPAND